MTPYDKLEPDITSQSELKPTIDLAVKYNLPSIVVSQDLYANATLIRMARQGRFKMIVPVDWPKGESQGVNKFRGTVTSCMEAEGFEITLSPTEHQHSARSEANQLIQFVRQFNKHAEIRFVIPTQVLEEQAIAAMAAGLAGIQTPELIRLGNALKLPTGKGSPDAHSVIATKVSTATGFRTKPSGNFGSIKSIINCPWAYRLAVSPQQLESIVKDSERLPSGLREALS